MNAELKPLIARHFDYSTRERGGQFFAGEFFLPKHESSLEDLISELASEHEKELHDAREAMEKAEDDLKHLKDEAESCIQHIEEAIESRDWNAVQTEVDTLENAI